MSAYRAQLAVVLGARLCPWPSPWCSTLLVLFVELCFTMFVTVMFHATVSVCRARPAVACGSRLAAAKVLCFQQSLSLLWFVLKGVCVGLGLRWRRKLVSLNFYAYVVSHYDEWLMCFAHGIYINKYSTTSDHLRRLLVTREVGFLSGMLLSWFTVAE